MDAKLSECKQSQDENAEDTPLVETSQNGSLQRSEAPKNNEHSFEMAQSMTTGAQQYEQDQQEGSSIVLLQPEVLKSLDSDIEKKVTSSLHQTDLAELIKDEDPLLEGDATNDSPSNRSSWIDIDDIVINIEPSLPTIMEGQCLLIILFS